MEEQYLCLPKFYMSAEINGRWERNSCVYITVSKKGNLLFVDKSDGESL